MKLINMTPWKGGKQNFMNFQQECAHVLPPRCMEKSLDPPTDGSYMVNKFIAWMHHIIEHHQVHALDTFVIGINVQWWEAHVDPPREWETMEDSMRERFRQDIHISQYMFSCERRWITKQRYGERSRYLKAPCTLP
jgi:hypothetical protein